MSSSFQTDWNEEGKGCVAVGKARLLTGRQLAPLGTHWHGPKYTHTQILKEKNTPNVMTPVCNPATPKQETVSMPEVGGELQASQVYVVRTCLRGGVKRWVGGENNICSLLGDSCNLP